MELRIFRSFNWFPVLDGRLGGTPRYELLPFDRLQYRPITSHGDWIDVPIIEGEKPIHPDEARRNQDLKDLNITIDNLIASGTIKLPDRKD